MGIGDWLKGKRGGTPQGPAPVRRPDELITVFDGRGRELKIKRADWVSGVLGPNLEKHRDNADALYAAIVQALDDDFVEQVQEAARRLVEVDGESERSLVVGAIVKMKLGDLDGARSDLQRSLNKHGDSGYVFTNLAKVEEEAGDKVQSRATLRRGLTLDPNQDNGLLWWAALAREEGGETRYQAALEEIAAIPGAWRPQLWLARERLARGDRPGALALYERVLSSGSGDAGVLMMVTGDLGNAGALEDLIRLAVPVYKPEVHGPPAGLNIVQALKQLGRIDEARATVRRLQAMPWPPFAARLAELEAELVDASLPRADESVPRVTAVNFDTPPWTRGLFEPTWLLPEPAEDAALVAFSTLAHQVNDDVRSVQVRKADDLGRLTRALPLYLAESLLLKHRVRVRCTLLAAEGKGPAVFGQQLGRELLESWLPAAPARRVVVTGTLVGAGVQFSLWEAGTGEAPAILSVAGPLEDVGALAARAEKALVAALAERAILSTDARPPPFYRTPPPELMGGYVSGLEQLFFQLLVANEVVTADSIWNERGYFETYFGLVDAWPAAPDSVRLLAITGVLAAARYKSGILEPYRKIVLDWIAQATPGGTLGRLVPAVLQRLGEQSRLHAWLQQVPPVLDAGYAAWLERVKAG
jgi:tetratricopeptide (TPR) repeat protein